MSGTVSELNERLIRLENRVARLEAEKAKKPKRPDGGNVG